MRRGATACSQLQTLYPGGTLLPGTLAYKVERVNNWDKRSSLSPACIFLPEDADQVAVAVKILHDAEAQFAIRGGGHMNIPGANSIDDGVLVALNKLDHTTVDESVTDKPIAVGPGAKWVDVYAALAPYGRYAIGGRLKNIGVPGLTLIGGVSYFQNKYGWSMDTVLRYDVVLGNGTRVVADKTTNRDLFWALKGGGNNFGIVTSFLFETYHVPLVSSTLQVFAGESSVRAFVQAACDMVSSDDGSIGAGGVFNIHYDAVTRSTITMAFGTQEGTESPPSRFSGFTAIKPALMRMHNVTEPLAWHSQFETPNQMFRIQFGHYTMKPDAAQLYSLYQQWVEAVHDISDVRGLAPTFVINLLPGASARPALTNCMGNVFGLRNEDLITDWMLVTSWANEKDDARVTSWAKSLLTRLHQQNREKSLASDFLYMGDAAEWQKPYETYGLVNNRRLRRIQAQYDPDCVFTRLNSGGFKLRR
ncbi:Glucooligosaccharide oxidase [Parathielavia hyrcaniae]|uniref:Glucooligosaccharide oxidase n=1 Tax=Parathielavia hyrcaniae TaxID=113614 RepID=A0AAN6T6C4_9PEZI|nr:Glucooligosaccharide oxidase [Parathielavia hyrcaniae]